jgi:hypothetical protein
MSNCLFLMVARVNAFFGYSKDKISKMTAASLPRPTMCAYRGYYV